MDLNENRKKRMAQVEQMLASSLTVADWCKRNKVSESTMYKWLALWRRENGDADPKRIGWVEIDRRGVREECALAIVGDAPSAPACSAVPKTEAQFAIRISSGGFTIEVASGTPEPDIARALRAVASL